MDQHRYIRHFHDFLRNESSHEVDLFEALDDEIQGNLFVIQLLVIYTFIEESMTATM